jgi:hypothetical protein
MPLQQKFSNSGLGKAFGAHTRPLGSHASPCRRPFTGTLKKDYFFLAAAGADFTGVAAPACIGLLGVVRGATGSSAKPALMLLACSSASEWTWQCRWNHTISIRTLTSCTPLSRPHSAVPVSQTLLVQRCPTPHSLLKQLLLQLDMPSCLTTWAALAALAS